MKAKTCLLKPRLTALLLLALAGAARGDETQNYIDDARAYIAQGNYNAGVIQLKNALQINPDSVEARLLLGSLYLQTGNAPAAEKELMRARDLGAERALWLAGLARAYLLQNKSDQVLEEIKVQPSDAPTVQGDVWAARGAAETAKQQPDAAKESFNRALTLNPNNFDAKVGVAQLALMAQDLEGAAVLAESAVQTDPQRVEGWLLQGEVHRLQNQPEPALRAFDKALALQSGNLLATLGRAETLLTLQRADEALASAQTLQQARPDHPSVNFLLGRILLQKQDFEGAESALQRVLLSDPQNLPSRLILGALNYNKQNWEQAYTFLSSFVTSVPGHLPARKLLAAVEMKLERPQQAVELLSGVLNQNLEDAQLLALLGSAYMQSNDYAKGSEYLQQAADLAPNASAIRTQLGLSLLASGNTEQAITQLETAVDLGQGLIQADVLLILSQVRSGQHDDAINTASALIDKLPGNPMPQNLLGVAHQAKGDLEQARTAFEKALSIDPDFHTARLNLARLELRNNDPTGAAGRYQQVLDSDPQHLQAMLGMADLAQRQGDNDGFLSWLERAWNSHPESLATGIQLVRQYLEQNDSLKALNTARQLQVQNPDNPATLRILGLAQLANNQPADALGSFRRLTTLQPQSPEGWHLVATTHLRTQNFQDATDAITEALKLAPNHLPSLALQTQLHLLNKQYDAALATAQRIQALDNAPALGFKLAGDIHMQQNQFPEAATAYQTAYDRNANGQLALLLSHAHRQAGDTEAALTALRKWLAVNPKDTRIRTQLAMYLDQMQRRADAIAEYEQVIELEPNNPVILNNLAWLYHVTGDARGIKLAERANELAPERPEIADTLGWILVQKGDPQRGLVLLQQAAVQAPHIPDIRYHLAVAYNQVGRQDEARQELEKLVSAGETFTDSAAALALLKQLQTP